MKKVYRYSLEGLSSPPPISIPCIHEVLHVGYQGEQLCVWVLVDPSSPLRDVRFEVVGTGWNVHRNWVYQGTAHEPDSFFIWHVFKVG